MRKFLLGCIAGCIAAVVVVGLGILLWARLGFVEPRADLPVGALETKMAMPSIEAAIDRRAPPAKNPLPPNDDTVSSGVMVYQMNCASCHGDIAHPRATLANALYPRAPQFLEDPPDMPENQNFYVIQHGIRWSGMPAWKGSLSGQEIWQVVAFLSQMKKLSPKVAQQWKTMASSN